MELENTFVRRRLHSLQAIEALFNLFSSLLEPGAPEAGPADDVLGAIGRKGLDDPCWAMARKTEAYEREREVMEANGKQESSD